MALRRNVVTQQMTVIANSGAYVSCACLQMLSCLQGVTSYAMTDGDIPKYNPVRTEIDCSCVRQCQYYVAYHQSHRDNNWYCPKWAGALLTAWCLFTTKECNQYTFNRHASLGAFA
jgi:hypothetical protein